MGNAALAQIDMELDSANAGYTQLTDSGDQQIYNSSDLLWSKSTDPVVRPNGISSGGQTIITPAASGTNNLVDIAKFNFFIAGVEYTHTAETDVTVTRGATAIQKSSLCVKAATPTAADLVQGADDASADVTTRGAAGGPPSIPLVSIEVGQVHYTSSTPAAVLATEIKQNAQANQRENYDYPDWDTPNGIGLGNIADDEDQTNAYVKLNSALEVAHGAAAESAATAAKPVWMDYYTPVMVTLGRTTDYQSADVSYTVSSEAIHQGKTQGSEDSSLGQTTFTCFTNDNVTDQIVKRRGKNAITRYYPDMNKTPFMLSQGRVSTVRNEPVSGASRSVTVAMADTDQTVGFDE